MIRIEFGPNRRSGRPIRTKCWRFSRFFIIFSARWTPNAMLTTNKHFLTSCDFWIHWIAPGSADSDQSVDDGLRAGGLTMRVQRAFTTCFIDQRSNFALLISAFKTETFCCRGLFKVMRACVGENRENRLSTDTVCFRILLYRRSLWAVNYYHGWIGNFCKNLVST